MYRFQFKLRSVFWVMTAVALACVLVPASPVLVTRFLADTRHWLVAVALGIFAAIAAGRKRMWRDENGPHPEAKLSNPD